MFPPFLFRLDGLLRGHGNIAQKNTTGDILVEDQLRPPLEKVTVDQEHAFRYGTNLQYKWCTDDTYHFRWFRRASAVD